MDRSAFEKKLRELFKKHDELIARRNEVDPRWDNGLYERYKHPVLTREHTPVFWRYDLNRESNPHLMERMGVNAVFNPGAIEHDGKILLVCRVEGWDRKSFFAVAESETGVDGFRFPLHARDRAPVDEYTLDAKAGPDLSVLTNDMVELPHVLSAAAARERDRPARPGGPAQEPDELPG